MSEKKSPVQDVRNVALEEKLDKLIGLITLQNKANDKILEFLNAIHTLLIEKYKSQELLLEKFPAVMGPPGPVASPRADRETAPTVGGSHQPQPFNDYSDSAPYGTELEDERDAEAETQSYPSPGVSMTSASETVVIPPESAPSQEAPQKSTASEQVERLEQPVQTAPKQAVTSRAEMLQQQENLPQE